MPNWCDNNLTIYGTKEKIKEITALIKDHAEWADEGHPEEYKSKYPKIDGKPIGLLYYCKPEPDYSVTPVAQTYPEISARYAKSEEEKEKLLKNEPTIRDDSWWDWRVQNWGTKWEIFPEICDIDEEHICMSFSSAWSPPIGAFEALLKQEGITEIEASYYEPGCAIAGVYTDGEHFYFETDKLTQKDFDENDKLWELDDCFGIYTDIMRNRPLDLRPELEKVMSGLGVEDCWEVDWDSISQIYETLKDEPITPGSIVLVTKEGSYFPTHFTFNGKEYKL